MLNLFLEFLIKNKKQINFVYQVRPDINVEPIIFYFVMCWYMSWGSTASFVFPPVKGKKKVQLFLNKQRHNC